jgi:predicted nucleotidyltransferase
MATERSRVSLLQSDTAEWKLWALVAEFGSHLDPTQWVLIGGQMVALHLHIAGRVPSRTTTDIDIVADLVSAPGSFNACKNAATNMNLTAQPSITGKTLHRFTGPSGQLDLMVADHLPARLTRQFTKPTPVSIPGGQRAINRRITVEVDTAHGSGVVPLPDLAGALVMKARAAGADTRDRMRHYTDLAQLPSIIDDPLDFRERLDAKEKRYLGRVRLADDPTRSPWLTINERTRQRALDAWFTLTGG